MANTDTFLGNMIGYHDIRVNGGSLLPRRNQINVVGGEVEDIGGETRISITTKAVWAPDITPLFADVNDYLPNSFATSSDIPIAPIIAARTVTGFSTVGLAVYTKRIWNTAGTALDLVIAHESASSLATNRVTSSFGTDVVIAMDEFVTLIRNSTDTRWLLLT